MFLGLWCGLYGGLNLLLIQSYTATIVPSAAGREPPDDLSFVLSLALGLGLFFVGAMIGLWSLPQPSWVLGAWGVVRLIVLLTLSLLALLRAGLGWGPLVSGDLGVMGVISQVWFTVAGVAGVALWGMLQLRRRQFLQHYRDNVRG